MTEQAKHGKNEKLRKKFFFSSSSTEKRSPNFGEFLGFAPPSRGPPNIFFLTVDEHRCRRRSLSSFCRIINDAFMHLMKHCIIYGI